MLTFFAHPPRILLSTPKGSADLIMEPYAPGRYATARIQVTEGDTVKSKIIHDADVMLAWKAIRGARNG